jgi:hypothetical protein
MQPEELKIHARAKPNTKQWSLFAASMARCTIKYFNSKFEIPLLTWSGQHLRRLKESGRSLKLSLWLLSSWTNNEHVGHSAHNLPTVLSKARAGATGAILEGGIPQRITGSRARHNAHHRKNQNQERSSASAHILQQQLQEHAVYHQSIVR